MGTFWDLGRFLVASAAVILFEQTENGNGHLHLVDGSVLPLLPDEAKRVQQFIRQILGEVNDVKHDFCTADKPGANATDHGVRDE